MEAKSNGDIVWFNLFVLCDNQNNYSGIFLPAIYSYSAGNMQIVPSLDSLSLIRVSLLPLRYIP